MKWEIEIKVVEDLSVLSPEEQELIQAARDATNAAYAPYSKFFVGAAVRLEDGTLISGSNQENAVYPLGLCAERVALFTAGNTHPNIPIAALAVTTKSEMSDPAIPQFPCGSCRQAILEFENRHDRPIKTYVVGGMGKVYIMDSIKEILPFAFKGDFLK